MENCRYTVSLMPAMIPSNGVQGNCIRYGSTMDTINTPINVSANARTILQKGVWYLPPVSKAAHQNREHKPQQPDVGDDSRLEQNPHVPIMDKGAAVEVFMIL